MIFSQLHKDGTQDFWATANLPILQTDFISLGSSTHDRMWTSLVFTCCCYFRINTTARVSELISDSTMLLIHDTVKLDEYKAIPTCPLILSLVDDPLINTVFIIVSCMHMLQHSYFLRHWLEAQVLLIPVSAFLFPFVQ